MHGHVPYAPFLQQIAGFLGSYYLFLAVMNAVAALLIWQSGRDKVLFRLPVFKLPFTASMAWLVVSMFFTILAPIAFSVYTATTEYRAEGTLGKQLMGIRVVRESGARIGLGQAWLRQLPFFFQFFLIDALFALFTERRQRAFELLTKTRAVVLLGVGLIVRS